MQSVPKAPSAGGFHSANASFFFPSILKAKEILKRINHWSFWIRVEENSVREINCGWCYGVVEAY